MGFELADVHWDVVILIAFILVLAQSPVQAVPAGIRVNATLETAVKTDSSDAGDVVLAVLNRSIEVDDKVVVPEGSRLHGRVETVQPGRAGSEGWLRLVFREIQFPDGRRVPTWMTNSFRASPPKRTARYIVYAGVGAVAGAVIGGDKARTTGILGGLLGGFLLATNTGHGVRDLTLRVGQEIWLELGQDLTVANDEDP